MEEDISVTGAARRVNAAIVFITASVPTLAGPPARATLAPQGLSERVREAIRERIEAAGHPLVLEVAGEPVYSRSALPRFYEGRTYTPAWSDEGGPRPRVNALLASIESSDDEGLNPEDYHQSAIRSTLRRAMEARRRGGPDVSALADLDLLLSDAFLIYGAHLVSGRVNPASIHPEWTATRRERDLVALLDTALANDRIGAALKSLLPTRSEYFGLRDALARYREIREAGGWPPLPGDARLETGSSGGRVVTLRRRLTASGELSPDLADGDTFDVALAEAVRRFQRDHGLDEDGVVGPATRSALNVSVGDRIAQIEANLERWRWLPENLGRRHIVVNIANFELVLTDSTGTALTMKVVVGQTYHRTPVFSDTMRYVVLNPYWNVPHSIAVREILPLVRKDPAYLTREHMEVLSSAEGTPVDPGTIDWGRVRAAEFPFRLRQLPGPANALGRVKFMFPNAYNVYLHDTPARELFTKSVRGFSHGCIRLEKPMELLAYVLRGSRMWTQERIRAVLERQRQTTIPIPDPLPIHILYWTAWTDAHGDLQFRNDIYGRDVPLQRALRTPPPRPSPTVVPR